MKLPVIDKPIYKTNILSRKEPVEYTPFTVKESKILMMARESDNIQDVADAVNQVLANCLIDKTINVKELPMVDMEWLFLNIQAKSSGEKIPLYFKCKNIPKGNTSECGMVLELEINLLDTVIANKDIERKIKISDEVGLVMKLPTFDITQRAMSANTNKEDQMLAALTIDYIYDKNSVYNSSDVSENELLEFVENLPTEKYRAIEKYFESVPYITQTIPCKCEKCGFVHEIVLKGLEDFFG
jgi:3-dehydroquinate synthetase